MQDDQDPAILLQKLGTKIIQFRTIPKNFPILLHAFSEKLLTSSSKNDPNQVKITEDFQGSVYILCKLAIVCHDCIPEDVFFLIFRTISALNLHFFSISKSEFSKFVTEFPISFVEPLFDSLITHFFTLPVNSRLLVVTMASILLFVYFCDSPDNNPFVTAVRKFNEPKFSEIFDSLTKHFGQTPAILLFYTFIIQNEQFKNFCLSKSDPNWILQIVPPLNKTDDQSHELRLNILLILTQDPSFLFSVSIEKSIIPKLLRDLISYTRHNLKDESHHQAINTALSVCVNLARKLNNFDSETGEPLIGLIRVLLVSKIGNRASQYLRLITMFIESVLVNRLKNNEELLYSVMRSSDVIKKLYYIKDNVDDPDEIERMVSNIEKIIAYFNPKVMELGDKITDYDSMLHCLINFVNDWQPMTTLNRKEPPVFEYQSNDTKSSLNYFRVIILKEFPVIL
ncbi:hypothetical protein TVAG_055060 [Trichomonas vaginalis G3]|uniref:Dymeclin n=1 Tax=Trichomonas vaginalis (strain ATCC PRA-98 / G3) TaxID=412133 RepID=A2ETH4_TRIV3|nr:hypothetical protein TVAG_055060 [Trichomonas vaginalis G3]|eukprot:XP_001316243.1 hypothetical protein [Trichomonas vaginalis G3]